LGPKPQPEVKLPELPKLPQRSECEVEPDPEPEREPDSDSGSEYELESETESVPLEPSVVQPVKQKVKKVLEI